MSGLLSKKDNAYAFGDAIDHAQLIEPEEEGGHHDPHIWGDLSLWSACLQVVLDGLTSVDPEGVAVYDVNASAYRQKLEQLDAWVKTQVAQVPEDQRVLITSHDAFNYLGRAYDFKVVAVQGISTVAEPGLGDITKTVDFIKQHGVKAIFVESSVNQATIKRISTDAGVSIGGELFSDAMGTPGEMHDVNGEQYAEGTFKGMVKHNINTIVNALK